MKHYQKRVDKHLFLGNATIYWWAGDAWRIQTKHKECIKVLFKDLYKVQYRPVSSKEQLVFKVEDQDFKRIFKAMTNAYRCGVEQIGEVA